MRQKPIEGFDRYEITDDGRVWSNYSQKWLKQKQDRDGYMRVNLRQQGKEKAYGVHRLVALAFVPNPDNLPEVNHINGDRTANDYTNLEWCSHRDNCSVLQTKKPVYNNNHLPVGKYDKEGNLIAVYATFTEAAKSLTIGGKVNTKLNHISQRCRNNERSKSYLGYIWKFVEEDANERFKLENNQNQ